MTGSTRVFSRMNRRDALFSMGATASVWLLGDHRMVSASQTSGSALVPMLAGDPIQLAGNPDLGACTSPEQEPVDFAIWQAADGSWQIWSCIRLQRCGEKTRLLHRWEGRTLTTPNWTPMGIAMQADPGFGEISGGLQAPHVVRVGDTYHMLYGAWESIGLAISYDGKSFARVLNREGKVSLFADGGNPRDPMVIHDGTRYIVYTTAHPGDQGAVYARTSTDLRNWSETKIVCAGAPGGDPRFDAECPHVYRHPTSGAYYLFCTQRYGQDALTTVFRSNDPLDFNDDRSKVAQLPVAAPEIVEHDGATWIAYLNPGLDGIRLQRLVFEPAKA